MDTVLLLQVFNGNSEIKANFKLYKNVFIVKKILENPCR